MTEYRVIEIRRVLGEAVIEADSYAEALQKAQTLSDDDYELFEWSDDGRTSVRIQLEDATGELWFEKARPKHTVRILGHYLYTAPTLNTVVYQHIGVHNKRSQSANTITEEKLFLKRFQKVST
jgi:hypothetical protein